MSKKLTTKTLASCAVLTALAVVLARLLGITPSESVRISFESVPVFLSGLLFGPVAGVLVGFTQDFLGSALFSPFGYNPLFCVPPILYGLAGGLVRRWILQKPTIPRIAAAYYAAAALGSVLYQSWALSMIYTDSIFLAFLTARSVQFAAVAAVDTLLTWLLLKSKVFQKVGIL